MTVTDDDHLPGPPTGLTATLTHLDFDVSWTAPANTGSGPILGYRIDAPGANPRNYYVNTTAPEIIETANSPRDYTVRVRGFNYAGDGDWSDPIVVSVRRATITIAGNDRVIEGSDAVFTLTTDLVNRYKVNGQSCIRQGSGLRSHRSAQSWTKDARGDSAATKRDAQSEFEHRHAGARSPYSCNRKTRPT